MATREQAGLETLSRFYGDWQVDASGYYPNAQRTIASEEQVVWQGAKRLLERQMREYAAARGHAGARMKTADYKRGVRDRFGQISQRIAALRGAAHAALEAGQSVDPIALATEYHNIVSDSQPAPGAIENLRVELHNTAIYGLDNPRLENQYGSLAATLLLTGILNANVDGLTLQMTTDLPEDHHSAPGTAFSTQPRFAIEPVLAAEALPAPQATPATV